MTAFQKYHDTSVVLSRKITRAYSTSFSLGISLLKPAKRPHIYAIYGFVRLADEIVDSFLGYNQEALFRRFESQTWQAIEEGVSTNPILQAFQYTYHRFNFEKELVQRFLYSMSMDLNLAAHDQRSIEEYILGSAEVVGLMCLHVFVDGDPSTYEQLKPSAMRLGSAFQKVNFLRDIKEDSLGLGRTYFPDTNFSTIDNADLQVIIADIEDDFRQALIGIRQLPISVRFGVFVAYKYYIALLRKIKRSPVERIKTTRVRISNWQKLLITLSAAMTMKFGKT